MAVYAADPGENSGSAGEGVFQDLCLGSLWRKGLEELVVQLPVERRETCPVDRHDELTAINEWLHLLRNTLF
ncbi:hypothetical protein [Actinomadura nitritigenes]|uniref:hypothetical protein n=1 Tax=Actinomadura nitritigenes TaxID=134602 RepID=UPI003D89E1F4